MRNVFEMFLQMLFGGKRLNLFGANVAVGTQLLDFLANQTSTAPVGHRFESPNVVGLLELDELVDPDDGVAVLSGPFQVVRAFPLVALVAQVLVVKGKSSLAYAALEWTQMHYIMRFGVAFRPKSFIAKQTKQTILRKQQNFSETNICFQ